MLGLFFTSHADESPQSGHNTREISQRIPYSPHSLWSSRAKNSEKTTGLPEKARGRGGVSNLACEKRLFPTTTATSNVWTPGFVESVRWFWLEAGPWAPPLNSASGFWASVWLIDSWISWISCLLIQLVWNKSSLFLYFSFDFFFIFDLILWLPKFLSRYYILSLSNWCDMIWTVQQKSKVIFYPHFK